MKERLKLAYASLGGALAWFFHLLATYTVGEFACVAQGTAFSLLGMTAAAWFLIIFSLIAVAATLGAGWVCWTWSRSFKGKEIPPERAGFLWLLRASLVANAVFLSVIVAQIIPIFILPEGC